MIAIVHVMAVADCPVLHQSPSEYELLRCYFTKGYTYKDIKHGISLTEDQLRRKFKKLGLKRRGGDIESSLEEVQAAIEV